MASYQPSFVHKAFSIKMLFHHIPIVSTRLTNNDFYLQRAVSYTGCMAYSYYRKTSSISRTKSQSLNVSYILLQLSSLNLLKPGVELRMKM